MDIRGKGTLVTGGSRGLGRALATELATRGARVAVVARGADALDATVRAIRDAGGEAHAIVADVGVKEDAHRIAGVAAALVGDVELVVHNASTLGPLVGGLRLGLDTDCEDLERALAVNLVGPFRLTKILAGAMALRGRGLVVNVSSDAAVAAYPRWGAYGASKAAADFLARTFAAELDGTGVKFLSVDPGEMDTRMHAEAMPEVDCATLADPREVARALAWLVDNDGDFASGARLEAARLRVTP